MDDYLDGIRRRLGVIGIELTVDLVDRIAARLGPGVPAIARPVFLVAPTAAPPGPAPSPPLFDEATAPAAIGAVWHALLNDGIEWGEGGLTVVLAVHHAAQADPVLAEQHL